MKSILKYSCVCLLISACASLSTPKQNKSFVILNTKDTVYAHKIRFARGVGEIGKVQLKQANGTKQFFSYDEIYQIHYYRKKRDFYVEEMVALTPGNPVSLTLMDPVVTNGNLKLYEHDPTNWGNTSFVVGDLYHGYVRTNEEYAALLSILKKCDVFTEEFIKNKKLKTLIRHYNEHCSRN